MTEADMATRIRPALTVADLALMPEDGNRYEVIEGELFVTRASGLHHQRLSGRLFLALSAYLEQHPVGEVFQAPGVLFDDFSGVVPDLVFISHGRLGEVAAGDRIEGAPELLIEILSPGAENIRRDHVVKRQAYGKHGVLEYWIVDPNAQTVEVYGLERGVLELQGRFGVEDKVTSSVLKGLELIVGDLFARS